MILDLPRFEALSPHSRQLVLCRCDACGAEREVRKDSIVANGNQYARCGPCGARHAGLKARGRKQSDEHRRKTGLASRGRPCSPTVIALNKQRRGPLNNRWNPDREAVQRNQHAKRAMYALLHNTLRRLGTKKSDHAVKLLGYSAQDLYAHINALLLPGMTWANRSEWHIDHVKPVAQFAREGVTDPKVVNALSNLQPLWQTDNISKGDRHALAA